MAKKIKTIKITANEIPAEGGTMVTSPAFENTESNEIAVEVHPSFSQVLSKETGIKAKTLTLINDEFKQFIENAIELKKKAESIVVTDASQKNLMLEARELRLSIRSIRTNADNIRKNLKQDSIRYGNAVQGVYNIIHDIVKPIEEHLEQQEKYVEILQQKETEELKQKRRELLVGLEDFFPMGIDLVLLHEDDFNKMLTSAQFQKEAMEARKKQEEEDRLKKQKEEEAERERVKEENRRFQEEREKALEEARKAAQEEAEKKEADKKNRIEILGKNNIYYNPYGLAKFVSVYENENFLYNDNSVFEADFKEFEEIVLPRMLNKLQEFKKEVDEKIIIAKQWAALKEAREKRFFELGFLRGVETDTLSIAFDEKTGLTIRAFNKGKGYMERNDEDFEKAYNELVKMVEDGKRFAEEQKAERLRQEEEETQSAASDKERLQAFIDKVSILDAEFPELKSKKGKQISKLTSGILGQLQTTLEGYLKELS